MGKREKQMSKNNFNKLLNQYNNNKEVDCIKIYHKKFNEVTKEVDNYIDYFDFNRLNYFASYGITLNNKRLILIPVTTPKKLKDDGYGIEKIAITKVYKKLLKFEEFELEFETPFYVIVDKIDDLNYSLKFLKVDDFLQTINLTLEELQEKWIPITSEFLSDKMLDEFMIDMREKYKDKKKRGRPKKEVN